MMRSSVEVSSASSANNSEGSFPSRMSTSIGRLIFVYSDKTTTYVKTRWVALLFSFVGLVARVFHVKGFYVVLYAWAIYLLNLGIGFVSPQFDSESEAYILPVRDSDEYRPFQRRIPEFQFWSSAMRATMFSLFLTLFSMFDLPVFWPILLIYFILLFTMTVKNQVAHMVKHKYVPFSWGKQKYGDIVRDNTTPQNRDDNSNKTRSSAGMSGKGRGAQARSD
eukprot:Lankesteria_metandrocarpae@DN2764_c0_g1_i1.p1